VGVIVEDRRPVHARCWGVVKISFPLRELRAKVF
jgi:hypothetical protein